MASKKARRLVLVFGDQHSAHDPKQATGPDACPFTTLYWDFLSRHRNRLRDNRRVSLQLENLDRKSLSERREIRQRADELKTELTRETWL